MVAKSARRPTTKKTSAKKTKPTKSIKKTKPAKTAKKRIKKQTVVVNPMPPSVPAVAAPSSGFGDDEMQPVAIDNLAGTGF